MKQIKKTVIILTLAVSLFWFLYYYFVFSGMRLIFKRPEPTNHFDIYGR